MLQRLCFRLLPIQVLLAAVNLVNNIVSSLFASNFVGTDAMSAIGLYTPFNTFFLAVSTMMMGGSTIICGRYMGKNQTSGMQNIFSADLMLAVGLGGTAALAFVTAGTFDLTGFFTDDVAVRAQFNQYLIGMAIGIIPQFVGQQLSAFLSLENQNKLTTLASVIYILVNLALNFLFVAVLKMGLFGLALATATGLWVFALVQLQFYVRAKSMFRLSFRKLLLKDSTEIVKVGAPGALSLGYLTVRELIINILIVKFVGSVGVSAFAATNSFLALFWSIPNGMIAVSRMLISVSVGEEDPQSLQNVMRIMFRRYLPLMSAVVVTLLACAVPLTRMYYQDTTDPVFMMTVWGFRILPLSMPMSIICMHFLCYAQVSGKKVMMHLLPVVDGLLGAAIPMALLIPHFGQVSVYNANVISGIATTVIIVGYAWIQNRHFPRNMAELMVIPKDFGVMPEDRLDITVRSMEEVVNVSRLVQSFCKEKNVDKRRSYYAALMVEEMAGNIVAHGFTKDVSRHSVDIRVVRKNQDLIVRIKDDCIPFDPSERSKMIDPEDITKNIGIRMVYSLARDVQYKNILGMNALTILL